MQQMIFEPGQRYRSSFCQLRDLKVLIEENETTKKWSEGGLRSAKKCVEDCKTMITKPRKLLAKSIASASSEEVSRDDIDISKIERAKWPLYNPRWRCVERSSRVLSRIS